MNVKRVFLALLTILYITICAHATDLDEIRKSFEKSVTDKQLCLLMISKLNATKENPVHLAYLGGFEAVMANHLVNPLSKLQTFTRGKKKIEMAVKYEPNNVEIRLIRLTIQMNCPAFLGYSSNIEEDRKLIHEGYHNIESRLLQDMVTSIIGN
jgi:hypothetical protein